MKYFFKKLIILLLLISSIGLSSCNFNLANPGYEEPSDNPNISGNNNTNNEQNNNENSSSSDKDNSTTLEEEITEKFDVHFVFNNGKNNYTISVLKGTDSFTKPSTPTKAGFIFDCWCSDEELTTEYDFSCDITKETFIYARYIIDYAYLTNKITTEIMSSNVTVINSKYYSNSISTGSGVIYKKETYGSINKYYILTNNHVIDNTSNNYEYSIKDYLNNTLTKVDNHVSLIASSSDYDLAVLSFSSDKEYKVIDLALNDPEVGDEIISLGQPEGQTNSITYGKITKYTNVTSDGTSSNIEFKVPSHNAYLNNGSSGGALLNTDLQLVGINFAGIFVNSEFSSGYAVQISKVKEFLNLKGLI